MDLQSLYESHFGVAAGYLPGDLNAIAEWHKQMTTELTEAEKDGPLVDHSAVAALRHLLDSDLKLRGLDESIIEESHGLTGQSFDGPVVWGLQA